MLTYKYNLPHILFSFSRNFWTRPMKMKTKLKNFLIGFIVCGITMIVINLYPYISSEYNKQKDVNIIQEALETNNITLCNEVGEGKYEDYDTPSKLKKICIAKIIKKNKEPIHNYDFSICKNLENEARAFCYYSCASENNDPGVCEQDKSGCCYLAYAVENGKYHLCDRIREYEIRQQCHIYKRMTEGKRYRIISSTPVCPLIGY